MKNKFHKLKNWYLESGGTASGAMGALGSVSNVCHSVCMSIVSAFAILGITLNALPLMFLQTYQRYFWWAAFAFTIVSLYFHLQQVPPRKSRDRNLLLINAGLLIFGLPFSAVADYMDFFRFIGLGLVFIGLFLFFFGKRFRFADQSVAEKTQITSSLPRENPPSPQAMDGQSKEVAPRPSPIALKFYLPKFKASSILFALVVGGFLVNQYMMYRLNIINNANILSNSAGANPMVAVLKKLTAFDVALAKERMDKNNDGICDVCGMPIEQCIDSGQMDCTMGGNKNGIGILGSEHIHADLKVYVNGQAQDFAKPEYYMKSSFMHLDYNPNNEDAGSVLHQHAKKVPLWLFFRSIGMTLSQDSLTTTDGRILKSENGNTLKFYLNGKKVDELGDYSFQPLDKLLISYGPANDPNIKKQIDSLTNFAKNH